MFYKILLGGGLLLIISIVYYLQQFGSNITGSVMSSSSQSNSIEPSVKSSNFDSSNHLTNDHKEKMDTKLNPPRTEILVASGIVTDGQTNAPVEGVTISIIGIVGESTITNKAGEFSLTSKAVMKFDEYRLQFYKKGYEPIFRTYHSANKIIEMKIFEVHSLVE